MDNFEELLAENPEGAALSVNRKGHPNVAQWVRKGDLPQLEACLPHLEHTLVNTTPVMMALLECFDEKIATVLFANGLNLSGLWDDSGKLICDLPLNFVDWLSANASNFPQHIEKLLSDAFEALHAPVSPHQCLALSAFAIQINQTQPDRYTRFLKRYDFFSALLKLNPKDVLPQQWDMVAQCVPPNLWTQHIYKLSIENLKGFKAFWAAYKNVPSLKHTLDAIFERSSTQFNWLQQAMVSATGRINDCALMQTLNSTQQQEAQKFLKSGLNREFKSLKTPENLHLLLSAKDPYVLNEDHYEGHGWFSNLYYANGFQNFLHILLFMCGAEGVTLLKPTDTVQEELAKTFHMLDMFNFIGSSQPSDINELLHTFPQLAHWKDVAGNNLGHYISQSHKTKAWKNDKDILDILLQHPPLQESNPYGVSPRDLLAKHFSDPLLAQYDKNLLQKELEGVPKPPKAPKFKRKI